MNDLQSIIQPLVRRLSRLESQETPQMVYGEQIVTIPIGVRTGNIAIAFDPTFAAIPQVQVTLQQGLAAAEMPAACFAHTRSVTGCTLQLDAFINVAAQRDVTVAWCAIG